MDRDPFEMIRRITASFGLLFLLSASVWAQTVQPIQTTSAANVTTCSFGQDVLNGSFMVFFANSEAALTLPTSLRGESWVLVESNTATPVFTYAWIGTTTSSGPETITLTGALAFVGCVGAEFPGSYGWALDGGAHTNGIPPGNSFTTSSITTSTNGDLLLAYASGDTYQSNPYLNGHPFDDDGGAGYKIAGTNGSYDISFNAFGSATTGGYVFFAVKPSALTIVTSSLPTGALTHSYSYAVRAVGGAGAYTWSVSAGALPTGLTLNAGTGVISGTPTGGSSTPTIRVTDGTNSATAALPLTVNGSAGTPSVVNFSCSGSPISLSETAGNVILVTSNLFERIGPVFPPTSTNGTVFRLLGSYASPKNSFAITGFDLYGGVAGSTATDSIGIGGCAVQFANAQLFWDTLDFTSGQSAASATLTGPTITTLAPNSLLWVAADSSESSVVFTAVAPFTLDFNSASSAATGAEHNIETAVGSYTPQITQASGDAWNIGALALRPATSVPVAIGVPRHKTPIF